MKIERLSKLNACRGAKEWAKSYADLESAWLACDRGDRMAWYLRRVCKTEADKRKVVGVLAEIVGTVIHLTTDQRVRDCLEACKAYARGVDVDLRSASAASSAAAYAASAEAATAAEATDAAYAAACATSCATAADDAYAAAYASCAASAAAYAAEAATAEDASVYASARTASLKRSADLIRKHYPTIPSI